MSYLQTRRCVPCEGGTPVLDTEACALLLAELQGWTIVHGSLYQVFHFVNYYTTMAFVNAVAWIAHREDHHPDLSVHYNRCEVRYMTHAAGGLTENDFICAAKISALQSE